jgi:hypothetical protein
MTLGIVAAGLLILFIGFLFGFISASSSSSDDASEAMFERVRQSRIEYENFVFSQIKELEYKRGYHSGLVHAREIMTTGRKMK